MAATLPDVPSEHAPPMPALEATGAHRSSLKRLALRGSAWTTAGFGLGQVLRLVANLVVARLLFPEAFGLMTIVLVFMQGLEMFSDVGIGASIIQNRRGDALRFLNTAWTIQVIRGVGLWLAATALSGPAARFYDQPILAQLLPVSALTALFAGFNATAMHSCRRHLKLGRLTLLQLAAQVCGIVVMVVWAWLSPTVWALVAAGLVTALVTSVFSHWVLGEPRNRLSWDADSRRELFRFGRWIFLSSIVGFLSLQYDRLWLGKYVPMGLLGVYGIAMMMVRVPIDLNMRLVRSVAYAAVSRIHREQPHRVREIYNRSRRALDLMFLPGLGLVMGGGHMLIDLLYDARYLAAGWMLQLLCIRAAMRCMLEPAESCLVAMGYPRYALWQHILRFTWIGVGMPLGWRWAGFDGVVLVVATSELLIVPLFWRALARRGILDLRMEMRGAAMLTLGVLVGVSVSRLILD